MKGWFRRHALRRPSGPPETPPADAGDFPRAATERAAPEDLWERCPQCREILYARELHGNLQVCPKCGHHGRLTAPERLAQLTDPGTWRELDANLSAADPIGFVRPGRESYAAKLNEEIAAHRQRTAGLLQEVGEQVGLSRRSRSLSTANTAPSYRRRRTVRPPSPVQRRYCVKPPSMVLPALKASLSCWL